MDKFGMAAPDVDCLSSGVSLADTHVSDDSIATELAELFGRDLEINDVYSDDLDFLGDE